MPRDNKAPSYLRTLFVDFIYDFTDLMRCNRENLCLSTKKGFETKK